MVERFVENLEDACSERPLIAFRRLLAGDNDDGDAGALIHPAQPIHDEEAIPGHATARAHIRREVEIQQDQVELFAPHRGNRLGAIRGGEHLIAVGLKHVRKDLQDDQVVIHHQNSLPRSGSGWCCHDWFNEFVHLLPAGLDRPVARC